MSLLDFVTGRAYSSTSTARTEEAEEGKGGDEAEVREGEGVGRGIERERTIACPFASAFPSLKIHELSSNFTTDLSEKEQEEEEEEGRGEEERGKCEYRFSRIYDCERHLRAVHGIELQIGGSLSDLEEPEEEKEESEVE